MTKQKNALFKAVPDAVRKDTAILVRISQIENDQIRYSASIRNLSVAEFMRRAALGRKADVRYETEIVLQLSEVTRVLRGLHREMIAKGMSPPEAIWTPVMDAALAAMIRISK
jgi:hypothetical protein